MPQNSATPIRVIVADDTAIIRRSICSLLKYRTDIVVVGECADFAQALQMVQEMKPHVVILDLHMPDQTQVVSSHIKAQFQALGIASIAISIWNDPETLPLAEDFGAAALLNKIELGEKLIKARHGLSQTALKPICRARYGYLISVGDQIVDLVRRIEGHRSRQNRPRPK
jgi:DNA-binding NarL/FixJ family response regulator